MTLITFLIPQLYKCRAVWIEVIIFILAVAVTVAVTHGWKMYVLRRMCVEVPLGELIIWSSYVWSGAIFCRVAEGKWKEWEGRFRWTTAMDKRNMQSRPKQKIDIHDCNAVNENTMHNPHHRGRMPLPSCRGSNKEEQHDKSLDPPWRSWWGCPGAAITTAITPTAPILTTPTKTGKPMTSWSLWRTAPSWWPDDHGCGSNPQRPTAINPMPKTAMMVLTKN